MLVSIWVDPEQTHEIWFKGLSVVTFAVRRLGCQWWIARARPSCTATAVPRRWNTLTN